MKRRPGIILPFDLLETLELFTPDEVGRLVLAALRYGGRGEDTAFEDRGLQAIFNQLKRSDDRDAEGWVRKAAAAQYSALCRGWNEKGVTPPDRESWIEDEVKRLLAVAGKR